MNWRQKSCSELYPAENATSFILKSAVKLVVVDKSGFSQSFYTADDQIVTFDYRLNQGWNLISIPCEDADVEALKSIGQLWGWDGNKYVAVDKAEAMQGVWLYSKSKAEVVMSGTKVADASVLLNIGWNLVGPAQNCKTPAGLTIYTWDTAYQQILDKSGGLILGHGYWMYTDKKLEVKLK